jgi:membrane protease YdiL (CAAX protease family)
MKLNSERNYDMLDNPLGSAGDELYSKEPVSDGQAQQQKNCLAMLKTQSGALALAVIVNILLLYLFQIAASWISRHLMEPSADRFLSEAAINELFTMLVYILAFLLPYLVYARLIRYSLKEIPRAVPYPPVLAASTGVFLGVAVAARIVSIILLSFFLLFGLYPDSAILEVPADLLASVLYICNTVILPPLLEEFVNRGIIMGSLRRYGNRFAIVISAGIFALLHRSMAQIPNAFLLGLALGYFVVKTDSIWTGVLLHFFNNLIALVMAVVTTNMNEMQAWFCNGLLLLLFLIACALGLIYFLGIRRLNMSLPPSGCPVREKALYRAFIAHVPVVTILLLFAWVIHLYFIRV